MNVSALSAIGESRCSLPGGGEALGWGMNISALSAIDESLRLLPRNGDEGVTIDERGVNHEQTWGVNVEARGEPA